MGRQLNPVSSAIEAEIVHIEHSHEPTGPAENAFILVEISRDPPRARYLSWINYFDLEYAAHREVGAWALVEPSEAYRKDVAWWPYGWSGARSVPTIGDAVLEETKGK